MRKNPRVIVLTAALLSSGLLLSASVTASMLQDRAQPRPGSEQRRTGEPQRGGTEAGRDREPEPRRAQPRNEDQDRDRQARPRPPSPPPPRVNPPRYPAPHVYYFPPVSVHRSWYYHPYFGFYYGPYYGPYYPYPGPFQGRPRYSESALRTRVKPVETEVYVNGYYAGQVDDFDGFFQRLYLPAGKHEVTFRLDGYASHTVRLYLSPGDTRDIEHVMRPLPPGSVSAVPVPVQPLPENWSVPDQAAGDRPSSPYGMLKMRIVPAGAEVFVDGEPWLATDEQTDFVLHVPAGSHEIEVRKAGYQTFRTTVRLAEGATAPLNVQLMQ
jgi:hypothetical protein